MGDILIRGIEMPKEGEELVITIFNNQVYISSGVFKRNLIEGATAIELPEHEDLISKQKTVKNLMEVMCAGCKHTDDCSWCSMAEYREIVENAPTVLGASK